MPEGVSADVCRKREQTKIESDNSLINDLIFILLLKKLGAWGW
jgi:hypothetical protein